MPVGTLDKFGRVVIPKPLRDDLGLAAGAEIVIEGDGERITITPAGQDAPVKMKNGVLVFTGRATGDIESALARQREERTRAVAGTGWE